MTDDFVIPEEVVRRASFAFAERHTPGWEDLPEALQAVEAAGCFEPTRAVLEAALPHLRAHQARPVVDRGALIKAAADALYRDRWLGDPTEGQFVGERYDAAEQQAVVAAIAILALLPTEAETKALAETATKLGVKLGRQEAADEIAAKCLRRAQLAERVPEGERSGVREGMVVTWLAAERLAREVADG